MKEKQTAKVLGFLQEHGSITDDDAYQMRIRRLSARIFDLRIHGVNIVTDMVTARDEDGAYRYASYRLVVES